MESLEEAKLNLLSFAENFENLYGEFNMVYNVHMITHLPDCVKYLGPLWAYSNYCFEDHVGHLVSLHKGTTDIAVQICEKYLFEKNLFEHFKYSPIAEDFYQTIDGKQKFKVSKKVAGSRVIGNAKKCSELSDDERTLIINTLNLTNDTQIDEYRKVLLNGKDFYENSQPLSNKKRTNDSFLLNTRSKKFAEIKSIFVIHENLFFLVNEKFDIDSNHVNKCSFIIDLKYSVSSNLQVIKPKYIGPKFALIKFNNTIVCSKFPNMYERN